MNNLAELPIENLWKLYPHTLAAHASKGQWVAHPHLRFASKKIAKALAKGNARLYFHMPPGYGKSQLISHWVPTWSLEMFGKVKIIETGYSDTHVKQFGREVLEEMNNERLAVRAKKDTAAAKDFKTLDDGQYWAAGIGGSLTGKHGNIILIDDPIKTWKEALSPTFRENLKNWFNSVLYMRKLKNSSIILLMTRWHEEDLAGYLLNEHPDKWEEIRLPELAEENDPMGRKPGETLCPAMFSQKEAEAKKKALPPVIYNALIRGTPGSIEGNLWKRKDFRFYTALPTRFDEVGVFSDMSMKGLKSSDRNAFQCWGRKGANCYLIDHVAFIGDFNAQKETFKRFVLKHPEAIGKYIEDAANGPAIVSALQHHISGLVLIDPQGGKEVRVIAAQPMMTAGNVYVPAPDPKNPELTARVKEFIDECANFPSARYDDQVDAASMALIHFSGKINADISGLLQM